MLIPVFTVLSRDLEGSTPTLCGIALGSYGLTQGLLQMPFGFISDRMGRKPVIALGLFLFAAGSLWGALTHSIYGMIGARILQGTGAVGSVLIALLADLTPHNTRTRAMAVIGGSIGLSFGIAMIASPAMATYGGLSSIFYFAFMLSLLGFLLLYGVIPNPHRLKPYPMSRDFFKAVLLNRSLMIFNTGIFLQHLILTATFFVLPLLLDEPQNKAIFYSPSLFYLIVVGGSFLLMIPPMIFAEKKKIVDKTLWLMTLIISIAEIGLAFFYHHMWALLIFCLLYFFAFNFLEALLPAQISKEAPSEIRGTAMGIYSTSQFLGIFAGGILAGYLYSFAGAFGIFSLLSVLSFLWALVLFFKKTSI